MRVVFIVLDSHKELCQLIVASVFRRAYAHSLLEKSAEIKRIGKSALRCNIPDWQICHGQKISCLR